MLNKAAITEFFRSGGVFYCGDNRDLKLSTMTALEECGMEIGFPFRNYDIDSYRYIFYSGFQVHMKWHKSDSDIVINAKEITSRFEIVDDTWSKDFRMPSFESLFCG